jgi:hypothetical protein
VRALRLSSAMVTSADLGVAQAGRWIDCCAWARTKTLRASRSRS